MAGGPSWRGTRNACLTPGGPAVTRGHPARRPQLAGSPQDEGRVSRAGLAGGAPAAACGYRVGCPVLGDELADDPADLRPRVDAGELVRHLQGALAIGRLIEHGPHRLAYRVRRRLVGREIDADTGPG